MKLFNKKSECRDHLYNLLDDQQLMTLICNDDESAFTALYNRHAAYLYAIAFRYLRDEFLAKDALQTLFMKLWDNRKNYATTQNLKSYLHVIIKNNVLNTIKRERMIVEKMHLMYQNNTNNCDTAYEPIEKKDIMELIQLEASKMPIIQQKILTLKKEGFSNTEIADELNMPLNTVKSYYTRTINMLKLKVKKK